MARLSQPQPFPRDYVPYSPDAPAFGALVTSQLAGVGDKHDTFDHDLSSTVRTVGSLPQSLAELDKHVDSASLAHEDLRRYDPGVSALHAQALKAVGDTEHDVVTALNIPGPSPQPSPGVAASGSTGQGASTAAGHSCAAATGVSCAPVPPPPYPIQRK